MAITQTITQLPPAPEASMEGAEFESHALAFVDAQDAFVDEINGLIAQINTESAAIDADAVSASNAATAALAAQSAAATSATAAATSATAAATSATAAETAKTAAAQSASQANDSKVAAAQSAAQLAAAINSIGKTTGTGLGKTKINVLSGQIIRDLGNVAGNLDFANMTRDAGATGEAYLHLNTGITPAQYKQPYYKIYGVDFELLLLHDERCFAYVGHGGIHSQKATQNGLNPYFYIGANGYAYLRLKLTGQYFNSIFIDGMMLYNGTADELVFTGGRITALTVSTI